MPAFGVAKAFHVMGGHQPAADLQAGMRQFQGLDEHTRGKIVKHLACDDSIEFPICHPYRQTSQHHADVMERRNLTACVRNRLSRSVDGE